MKHTKEQIIETAKKVMADIEWPYDKKKGVRPVFESIESQIEHVSSVKEHPRFEEYINTFFEYWDVFLDFPEEEGWEGRNTYIIKIKDEDREPYMIRHKQAKFKLIKNGEGKYQKTPFK